MNTKIKCGQGRQLS